MTPVSLTPSQFRVARHLARTERFRASFSELRRVASSSPSGASRILHQMEKAVLLVREGDEMALTYRAMQAYRHECEVRDAASGSMAMLMNAEEARAAESRMTFDLQDIKRQVRQRRRILEDRRSPLVQASHLLEKRTKQDGVLLSKLRTSVLTVEDAGGDATALKAQIAEVEARLGPDTDRLAEINAEWSLLNEVCKWIEMADDGLHWLIFAQSALDKHDKVGVWAPDYHQRKAIAA